MIRLSLEHPIARITLDRPEARNALSLDDWDRLADAVAQAVAAEARVIILAGAGGCFCAGADLTEFPLLQADPERRADFRQRMRRGIDALADASVAVIVAVAIACDIRVADPAARFAITPAKMGIGYPQEDVARLVGLVGTGQAARLLFSGGVIDAAEAARIGLAESISAAAEAERLAQEIAACDPASIAMLKRGIGLAAQGITADPEQDRLFEALLASPALAQALSRRRAGAALPGTKP
jgi:enoyl-CoA hydratase/carnithine racemase